MIAFRIILFAAVIPLLAQTASVRGTVVDLIPTVLPNVDVVVVSGSTKVTSKTNERGEFVFEGLLPGDYELSAAHLGFYTATVRSLTLRAGESKLLPAIRLAVAGSCGPQPRSVLELAPDDRPSEVRGTLRAGSERRPMARYTLVLHKEAGGTPDITVDTDEGGVFRFSRVPPGDYTLTAEGGIRERFGVSVGWDVMLLPLPLAQAAVVCE